MKWAKKNYTLLQKRSTVEWIKDYFWRQGLNIAQNGLYIAKGWWPDSPAFISQMLRFQGNVLYLKGNAEENFWRVEGREPDIITPSVKSMPFVILQKYQILKFLLITTFSIKSTHTYIYAFLSEISYLLSKKKIYFWAPPNMKIYTN